MATRDVPSHPVAAEEPQQPKGVLGKVKEALGLGGAAEPSGVEEHATAEERVEISQTKGPGTPSRGARAGPVCAPSEVRGGGVVTAADARSCPPRPPPACRACYAPLLTGWLAGSCAVASWLSQCCRTRVSATGGCWRRPALHHRPRRFHCFETQPLPSLTLL